MLLNYMERTVSQTLINSGLGAGMNILPRSDRQAILEALDASQARIEFDLKGIILDANPNFCAALGYSLAEIKGKHHRVFVDPDEAAGPTYQPFCNDLAAGKFDRRQYKRITKAGKEIWIEASYNPVFRGGKPFKVVKFATDITERKLKALDDARKLEAVARSQAIIEFGPDGTILTANANFCTTVGYDLSEIVGKHHRMFCDTAYSRSEDYARFWQSLASGTFSAGEFVRYGKGGREVWIQAAYNPIVDDRGKVYKVVKFATDVSERMSALTVLAEGLRAMKQGDLTHRLEKPFVLSMEKVRSDFNEAIEGVKRAIVEVGDNAESIAASSGELRSAASDLSKRTEQQAASVEETAAALEQITTTVKDSSRRADEAGKLVTTARDYAEQSSAVVKEAIGAMGEIAQSSKEISGIIGVIDEIAFQTNLLALNAGVEAARAGDAGKGFAVVAQEVRELAQRSARAAKEIDAIIKTSENQVTRGVSLVDKTGNALTSISGQIADIATNVHAIVEATREQSIGLQEVNQAVNTIDQGTQQNAAMVEQSTANSHKLAQEAQSLRDLFNRFRTGKEAVKPAPQRQQPVKPQAVSRPLVSGANALAVNEWEEF